ncbi:30 kDa heat shock protein [Chaetomium sp. MPI-SDFR-AT-0129]|nr:30 kDa heat shock protein [Chaetomium sp. MPI-SDFR-AT-0129]
MQSSRRLIVRNLSSLRPKQQQQPSIFSRSNIIKPSQRTSNMSTLWHPRFSHRSASPSISQGGGFSSLFQLLDDFDRYTGQSLLTPQASGGRTTGAGAVAAFSPRFDVTEHEKDYVLQGELPGVTPDQVDVEFTDDQTLVVRGRLEREHTEGDPSFAPAGTLTEGDTTTTGRVTEAEGEGEGEAKTGGNATGGAVAKGSESSVQAQGQGTRRAGPRYWVSERSYGEFSRVFTFPSAVDQDKVHAAFKDGILNITVPKTEKKSGKKITIQ